MHKVDLSSLYDINILVVDDNAHRRDTLYHQLVEWGATAECVPNAAEAINVMRGAAVQAVRYHVGILALDMRDSSGGLALAQKVNDEGIMPGMTLILLDTANLAQDGKHQAYPHIHYFLSWPLVPSELLDCLLHIMDASDEQVELPVKNIEPLLQWQKTSVLLAEGDPKHQNVCLAILANMGCYIDVAASAAELMEAVAAKAYDVILIDCHSPAIQGLQVGLAIRQQADYQLNAQALLVALAANSESGALFAFQAYGFNACLSKPFNKKELYDLFLYWIGHKLATESLLPTSAVQSVTPASTTSPDSLVNLSVFNALSSEATLHGENVLSNLVALFASNAPEALAEMRKARANYDAASLCKVVHHFRAAAHSLGAVSLSSAAAKLEVLTAQDKIKGSGALLAEMERDLPKVLEVLQQQLLPVATLPVAEPAVIDLQESEMLAVPPESPDVPASAALALEESSIQPDSSLLIIPPRATGALKRILLVDADEDTRLTTEAVLKSGDYAVLEATGGGQSIVQARAQHPDLIILNKVKDDLDIIDVCKQLQQDSQTANIPVVLLVDMADTEIIDRAFAAGASDFMVKPVNYPILLHRLGFLLRSSESVQELRRRQSQLSAAQRIARLGYWTWVPSINLFQISENLAQLCGLNLADFNNTLESFTRLVHPEDLHLVRDTISSACFSDQPKHIEYRLQVTPESIIVVQQELEVVNQNNQTIITGTVQDISHKKQLAEQIHRLAYYDSLTGLASRVYYHERIDTIIKIAKQRLEQFAFLFLDLDGFKNINDSFGHNVGDQFLQAIARRLRSEVRDIDFIARLGGDEFCIIISHVNNDAEVAEVTTRFLNKVNLPLTIGKHQIRPRTSIGIAIFPRDGSNENELMKAADVAMYSAKHAGKQRYAFYSADMTKNAIDSVQKEQALREAFAKNQFVLHYQPQISMHTGRIIAMEALIRWQHPDLGLLAPIDLLPYLEQFGSYCELGNWVINAVCSQLAQWHAAGMPYLPVAINVVHEQFQDPSLVDTIQKALARTGVPAQYLELEVPESTMQVELNLDTFKKLRQLGVKVAIDDFGTGYSSLASLRQLPLDSLKINKVFLDDVLKNRHTVLLLGSILGLSEALGYKLIIEGVETRDQALIMYGLGCDVVQGYFFSRPVTANKVPELLDVDFSVAQ